MENQPVDRDWEFEEKEKSGKRMQETHSTRFLIFCSKPSVQRRIPDQAEHQDDSAKQQPGPLRPSMVGAP
jgi:hypothetical protein